MSEIDEFERALADALTKVGAAARPPGDAWERLVRRFDSRPADRAEPDAREENLEVVMPTPDRQEPMTRRWRVYVGVAAAAALLIVGLVAFSDLRDDSAPADEPLPQVTTVPDGPDPTLAVSIAEQFLTALGELDAVAAISLVDADAQIQHYNQTATRAEIAVGVAMEEAVGGRTELQGCESTAPDQVRCEATYIDDRVETFGGVPGEMTYLVKVDNGLITAYRVGLDTDTFGSNPWESYKTFVFEQSQDDFAAMFASHPDGMGIIGPLLTEESVELHRQYTENFVLKHDDRS